MTKTSRITKQNPKLSRKKRGKQTLNIRPLMIIVYEVGIKMLKGKSYFRFKFVFKISIIILFLFCWHYQNYCYNLWNVRIDRFFAAFIFLRKTDSFVNTAFLFWKCKSHMKCNMSALIHWNCSLLKKATQTNLSFFLFDVNCCGFVFLQSPEMCFNHYMCTSE